MFLINKNFQLLWFGQLVSQLGDKAYNIALMWWLFEKTKSPLIVSSFLIVSVLPELIFGLIAGVYIDRWNKKRILIISDFARGIIILMIAVLQQLNLLEVWHVYLAAFIISLCSSMFNPTTMAIIPAIVKKDKLQQANALSQMVSGGVSIAGPLLGASSVALMGYTGIFVFNGVSYIASGVAAACLRIAAMESPDTIGIKTKVFDRLREGLRYVGENRKLLVIITVIAIVHVFVGGILVAMPFIAELLGGNGINNLGVLEAAIGIGMMLGSIYIARYMRKDFDEKFLFYAIICMGCGVLILGMLRCIAINSLPVYAVDCAIIGISVAVASVFWRTISQLCVATEFTGRVFSVLYAVGDISLPVSMGLFGVLLNSMEISFLLSVAGSCLIVFGIFLLYNNRMLFKQNIVNNLEDY